MAAKGNFIMNNLVQTIVQDPVFPETINSILTATNQEQSCLLLRLKSRNVRGASHHLAFTGNFLAIVDFGVSDAICLGGANSGQTSIKCCDLACNAGPPTLKNCKDLIMKLEVKYLFPTLSTVQLQLPNFPTSFFIFIYQLPENEVWEWEKHYHMVLECKTICKPGRIISGFSWSYTCLKPNLHSRTEISLMALLTPKSSVSHMCYPYLPSRWVLLL